MTKETTQMRTMTITEALAELKTIDKRLSKKRESIGHYLVRQEKLKDPLLSSGGSTAFIIAERQAVADLENNIVAIRTAIQAANNENHIAFGDTRKSITEWLIWRRDVAPKQQAFLQTMRNGINNARAQVQKLGAQAISAVEQATSENDLIVHIDEKKLADEIEQIETTLGNLDGQLSLKNATITVTI